ncbi:MAG: ribosomal protection-like ABC-F family protein [Chloroflexota bacterium]
MVLKASDLTKKYSGETVVHRVSLVLNAGDRLGLVGANGAGKTTVLRMLAGLITPDSGVLVVRQGARVAYLQPQPAADDAKTIRGMLAASVPVVGDLHARLEGLEEAVAAGGEEVLAEYDAVRVEYEQRGGYALDARVEEVARGLGLNRGGLDRRVHDLSGGLRTRLSLASVLLIGADVMLLDEPTTYLDLEALAWLEQFVADSRSAFIIASHDRRFLDRTVSAILELDATAHTLRRFTGGYSEYSEAKRLEAEKVWASYRAQETAIARARADIRRTREQAASTERATTDSSDRRLAKKVASKAKARERRLERFMESEDLLRKPVRGFGLSLGGLGRAAVRDDRIVFEMKNLSAGYGSKRVLRDVSLIVRGADRLAILGENGAGKSTLLRVIAGELEHAGALRLGESVRLGVLSQEADQLARDQTVLQVIRARTALPEDEARAYLHKFLFSGEQSLKSVAQLSSGERQKLSLACLIASDASCLLLDEPTSHLDILSLEAVESALGAYRGPFVLASHDRALLENVNVNRLVELNDGNLRELFQQPER